MESQAVVVAVLLFLGALILFDVAMLAILLT